MLRASKINNAHIENIAKKNEQNKSDKNCQKIRRKNKKAKNNTKKDITFVKEQKKQKEKP